jgi:hypothetical protein
VLPRAALEAMHLKRNDELFVVVKGGIAVIMSKPKSYQKALSGAGKGLFPKTHLKRERSAWSQP